MANKEQIYKELSGLDVSPYIETGGPDNKFRFLSWGKAWDLLVQRYPDATYEVVKNSEGLPYFRDGNEVSFVFTSVTIQGNTLEMWLPVQDENFRAIKKPDSMQVNKSIMRCLVKNIAMFGLGINLYIEDKEDIDKKSQQNISAELIASVYQELESRGKTRDEIAQLHPEGWTMVQYNQFLTALKGV